MDIVVKGRQVDLSERFREHVTERLEKVERFDPKIQRVDVEVSKEANPRMADRALRVELTIRSRGPVVRAEAASDDKYSALDAACDRLEARLRKAADRRNDHRRVTTLQSDTMLDASSSGPLEVTVEPPASESEDGPMDVREKTHVAAPMSLDQALAAMELVGHDFYLFLDTDTHRPAVVYRRRGYHYGVIRLETAEG